ncbi:hypothetical protein IJ380_00880 [Candidatus Saccharibacteria bacterium]|nr:hypothetical protein [Candidatus Saccharibacteria bacterium]
MSLSQRTIVNYGTSRPEFPGEFEAEMALAEARIDAELAKRVFDPEKVALEWAERDMNSLRKIEGRGCLAMIVERTLRTLECCDKDRESHWYGIGEQYYLDYLEKLVELVKATFPGRIVRAKDLPIWDSVPAYD